MATKRLEGGVLLEDGCKGLSLINANVVPEEICRRYCPPIACSRVTQAILFEMETVEDVQTAMVEDVEL